MSQAYHTRPSELLGIDSTHRAFYLDRQVWAFGSDLEGKMSEAESKAKSTSQSKAARMRVLNNALAPSGGVRRFRDPAARKAQDSEKSRSW